MPNEPEKLYNIYYEDERNMIPDLIVSVLEYGNNSCYFLSLFNVDNKDAQSN
jgi:hypothetical protein